mmetsp:Transcript_23929/g.57103  ORF Transcript_23929/g.57103 Transcript_23929/m.57103 type:complete len:260 (+) Transcript_23929:260-1039(+)
MALGARRLVHVLVLALGVVVLAHGVQDLETLRGANGRFGAVRHCVQQLLFLAAALKDGLFPCILCLERVCAQHLCTPLLLDAGDVLRCLLKLRGDLVVLLFPELHSLLRVEEEPRQFFVVLLICRVGEPHASFPSLIAEGDPGQCDIRPARPSRKQLRFRPGLGSNLWLAAASESSSHGSLALRSVWNLWLAAASLSSNHGSLAVRSVWWRWRMRTCRAGTSPRFLLLTCRAGSSQRFFLLTQDAAPNFCGLVADFLCL